MRICKLVLPMCNGKNICIDSESISLGSEIEHRSRGSRPVVYVVEVQ